MGAFSRLDFPTGNVSGFLEFRGRGIPLGNEKIRLGENPTRTARGKFLRGKNQVVRDHVGAFRIIQPCIGDPGQHMQLRGTFSKRRMREADRIAGRIFALRGKKMSISTQGFQMGREDRGKPRRSCNGAKTAGTRSDSMRSGGVNQFLNH